ncbi:hypothetical protein AB1Y20_011605 [Prymnesium parvum]|uniref:Uncharacterized protein n=1 Tax=Prymnesium parvum TaxID=97485 RepID=A0AB34IH08_PRYPA
MPLHAYWRPAPSLPFPLMGMQGGVYAGSLLTAGGYNSASITHSVLAYSATQGWERHGAAPSTRGVGSDDSGSAVLRGELYLVGGIWAQGGAVRNTSEMVAYDMAAQAWSYKRSMPTARRGLAVAADEALGRLYAVGGINCKADCYGEDVEYLSVVESYDAASDTWVSLPSMRTPRRDLAVAFVGGLLYVVGGCNGQGGGSSTNCVALATVEVYDTHTKIWTMAPTLNIPRHGLGVGICPMTNGKAFIVAFGGSAEPGIMNNPTPCGESESLRVSHAEGAAARWNHFANLSVPRYGLLKGYGLNLNGFLYSVGGSTVEPGKLSPSSSVVEKLDCNNLV